MLDLPSINRANERAAQGALNAALARNQYVVIEYHGLHFAGWSEHDNADAAAAKAAEINAVVGQNAKVVAPSKEALL